MKKMLLFAILCMTLNQIKCAEKPGQEADPQPQSFDNSDEAFTSLLKQIELNAILLCLEKKLDPGSYYWSSFDRNEPEQYLIEIICRTCPIDPETFVISIEVIQSKTTIYGLRICGNRLVPFSLEYTTAMAQELYAKTKKQGLKLPGVVIKPSPITGQKRPSQERLPSSSCSRTPQGQIPKRSR